MKEKTLALLSVIFMAMSITGFTYAQWNDTIVISNTMSFGYWGDLNMVFVYPLTCTEYHKDPSTAELVEGEYLGKDVGSSNCQYDYEITDTDTGKRGNKTLIITISNAYPSYEVHCNYTLENIGILPLHINETVISDPDGTLTWDPVQSALVDSGGNPIINITTTPSLVCNTLQPEDDPNTHQHENQAEFEMTIHATDNAQESHTYIFQVELIYEETT
ncbi:MAG: hypothetical protein JSV85_05495 [Candidatus Bathyarchaeota archaeon]|nr:MAG: hypothetical protein JSV85_05495 [Candidatus Bathyarchaeota archaeon]